MKLETERLLLRPWQSEDSEAFAQLNANVEVMRYFPHTLSKRESDELLAKFQARFETQGGWGLWATIEKTSGAFIGFVGLNRPEYALPFSPCVEVSWRLLPDFWGKGYAIEAANAALKFAFDALNLDEVVAFTTLNNTPSQRVMQRLKMQLHGQFTHPLLEASHPLAQHVLYKLTKKAWAATQ